MAGKAVRPRKAAVMCTAEMHVASTVATAMTMATTVTPAMSAAVAAAMTTAALGDHIARQRHREDTDCNSDCPSDHGFLPRNRSHRRIR